MIRANHCCFGTIAHQHSCEWKAKKRDTTQKQKSAAPPVMLDHPFGEWRNQNGSNTASAEQQGQRQASVGFEPGKDRASVRKLRGGVCNQPDHKKCEVELSDIRRQPAERCKCDSENQDPGKDDAMRRKAI